MGRISKKKIARAVVVVAAAVAIFVPVQNAMRKQLGIRSAKEEAALQDEDLQAYAEANGLTDEEALNALGIGKSVKEREKEEEQVMSHLEPVDENHGYTDEEIRTTPSDIDGMTLQDKKDARLVDRRLGFRRRRTDGQGRNREVSFGSAEVLHFRRPVLG